MDLQSNSLYGAIPPEITRLTHLEQLYLNDNLFSDLPDLSEFGENTHALGVLRVENNFLTFEDLEPNAGLSFTYSYAPQRAIMSRGETGIEGNRVELHIPVGGANNQYQWYKDRAALDGATSDSFTIEHMSRFEAGLYELEITNTLVTDLTLRTEPIRVVFDKPFTAQWLDIGAYHHAYSESGTRHEGANTPEGMEYPAILRHSGHIRAKAFWIGVKDWTDPQGQYYPYYVARMGPRRSGALVTFPIQNKLIGRYEDTLVEVDGVPSFGKEVILDEIDPGIAADRMIHNIHNLSVGITVDRKIYAYTNEYYDNYHIIEYTYCNTGNTDEDEEIELPDQTLHDVLFFRTHRWRGNEQTALAISSGQTWGRYTMNDVVGDAHEEYPVDFTAQYAWFGYDVISTSELGYNNLGGALFTDEDESVAEGDSIGRLSGPTMVGRSTIHADRSTTDASYDPDQPTTISWIDNDDLLTSDGASHEEYYEQGILTRENPDRNPGCASCFTRAYPHFADRVEPSGAFWDPTKDAAQGKAGGFSPATAYGPYEMAPGECVDVVVSEGIAGLSFDAATKIGRAYKRSGAGRETDIIEYDANGDGTIDTTPFDHSHVFVGGEAQTKNQWVMSARDSLFKMFYRARDLYAASHRMTTYPIIEPPHPPTRFSLWGQPDRIELEWTPASEGPVVDHWELFRTERWVDNLYVNGCLEDLSIVCGYNQVATLPTEATSYVDTDVSRGIDYFYYIQGVGEPQPEDPGALNGAPGGASLHSGRYLTQTYSPVALSSGTSVEDEVFPMRFAIEGNYPNPFHHETRIRYSLPTATDVELVVFDVLGREVEVLIREYQEAGRFEQLFNASGLASGVYVYVLRAGENTAEGKMLLVN